MPKKSEIEYVKNNFPCFRVGDKGPQILGYHPLTGEPIYKFEVDPRHEYSEIEVELQWQRK